MALEEMERRAMNRRAAQMKKSSDADVSVQLLMAEQAIKAVVPPELKKEWSAGRGGATSLIVPSPGWVSHIATAVDDIRDDLFVCMKTDGKKRDDEGAAIGRALTSGRGVVGIAPSVEYLPKLLKTVGDRTLQIVVTHAMVAAVVRIVAQGRLPKSFNTLKIELLDFDELCGLIVPTKSATEIHAAFERAILAKSIMARSGEALPNMEEAIEFGHARVWAMDLKQDLEDFQAGKISIADVDKGIILHGPPGTGKTLFARSLAGYLGIPVIISSMADFFAAGSGYLDSVIKAQREVFDRARAQKPCLLFIDELDACPDLDQAGRNKDWWAPVVNDFLALLDGATSDRSGVIVVGATNRLHAIAPALRRPGRFERQVYLGLPDKNGINRILRHHLGDDLQGCDLTDLAERCAQRSMSAADLMEKVRSGKRTARRENRPMSLDDLQGAILVKDERSVQDLRRVSVHEAGHALLAGLLCPELLVSVDIEIDENGAGGTTNLKRVTTLQMTKDLMHAQVRMLLAGRGAEIVLLGGNSAGGGGGVDSDLHKATSLLAMSALSFGLEEPRWRCKPDEAVAYLSLDPELQRAVEAQLAEAADDVEFMLNQHLPELETIAGALLAERSLSAKRVMEIIASTAVVPEPPLTIH